MTGWRRAGLAHVPSCSHLLAPDPSAVFKRPRHSAYLPAADSFVIFHQESRPALSAESVAGRGSALAKPLSSRQTRAGRSCARASSVLKGAPLGELQLALDLVLAVLAAVIGGAVAHRLGQPVLLGYLAGGVLIGP